MDNNKPYLPPPLEPNFPSQLVHTTQPTLPSISSTVPADTLNNSISPKEAVKPPVPHPEPLSRLYDMSVNEMSGYKPLNVKDALSYLDQVKQKFSDQPEVYNRFLDIMKEFKSQSISTPGVIDRVSTLFRGHPPLIMGFNTFLPPGYRIESTNNPDNPICVITPNDPHPYYSNPYQPPMLPSVSQITGGYAYAGSHQDASVSSLPTYTPVLPPFGIASVPMASHVAVAPPPEPVKAAAGTSMEEDYPNTANAQPVKRDLGSDHRAPVEFNQAINYVNKIKNRFSTEPEIYKKFLEILQTYQKEQKPIQEVYAQVQLLFNDATDLLEEFKQFLPDTSAPTSRHRGSISSNGGRRGKRPPPGSQTSASLAYQRKRARTAPFKPIPNAALDKSGTLEELEFFEKCKRVIGNKTTYNEFLKVLNLFSQEIIDAKVLVERVEPFLSHANDLYDWFKKFVRYEDEDVIYNVPLERPDVDLRTCRKSGHSYRLLPANLPRPQCSGRDGLSNEVLNNDWISHPVYVSETGFVSHKKTQYEEAMYKCEEERYEFDLNIEANLHTIALLEPWAKKLEGLNQEEKDVFRLPRDLGGFSTSIFQRVIKKIYDKDRGLEVIDAIFSNPSVAIPVVLKRLKQKDEEWKRSQREWNKVWREIDSKNFAKSLDHQGIHFKTSDRKAMSCKSLVTEIETLYREQRERHQRRNTASLSTNRYQLDFSFKDLDTFKDSIKILNTFLESNVSLSASDEKGIQDFISLLIDKFFLLRDSSSKDVVMTDLNAKAPRPCYSLYSNTLLYVFYRLFQMLYARLLKMKEISNELSRKPPAAVSLNNIAVELGFQKQASPLFTEKDRYTELLKNSVLFLSGDMDPIEYEDRARAMYGTSAYLVFTLDKLVQTLAKQIHTIITDAKSLDLMSLYKKDSEKPETSSRQEAVYRLSAESLMQDENLIRLEFFSQERVLTLQLLGKEDFISDDSFTAEEKWSFYVDQFVQLSTNEKLDGSSKEPFLKRNLPSFVGRESPSNVITRSGLELKICMSTYKIFFVDNTEDFFYRKVNSSILEEDSAKIVSARHVQFREWLEGDSTGWKKGLKDPFLHQAQFDEWLKGCSFTSKKGFGEDYRKFTRLTK